MNVVCLNDVYGSLQVTVTLLGAIADEINSGGSFYVEKLEEIVNDLKELDGAVEDQKIGDELNPQGDDFCCAELLFKLETVIHLIELVLIAEDCDAKKYRVPIVAGLFSADDVALDLFLRIENVIQ